MDKGFIFEHSGHYYFIKSNKAKKCKTILQNFLDFFISRYNGELTPQKIQGTYDYIKKYTYFATIRRSDDFTTYFIHAKDMGATISENDIIFIV